MTVALPRAPAGVARCEAVVDLAAVRENVAVLRGRTPAEVMAVVKADGYGHGLVEVARAALAAGAGRLGVAFVEEALALRAAGITAPVLCWLLAPGERRLDDAVRAGVELSAGARWTVAELAAAARRAGRPALVHLEADTGMGRGGAVAADWPGLVAAAGRARAAGELDVAGVWTHLAHADVPAHPANDRQLAAFRDALRVAAPLRPRLRHAACSAALLHLPAAHFDLVRPGIAVYGLGGPPGLLRPAMTLRSRVVGGVVPAGLRDGVPGRGDVLVAGRRRPIAGPVGPGAFAVAGRDGDEVVVFGPGDRGEPTVQEWADRLGTLPNEILTAVGRHVPRTHLNPDVSLPIGHRDPLRSVLRGRPPTAAFSVSEAARLSAGKDQP